MYVTTETDLGTFSWDVNINPDTKQLDITPLVPVGGLGPSPTSYVERVKLLLGDKYNGHRELQAFTEGLLIGAKAIYLSLCRGVVDCALTFEDTLDELALKECGDEELLIRFQVGCTFLHQQLIQEINYHFPLETRTTKS